MLKKLRKIKVKTLVMLGLAVDIGRKNNYPANVISNSWNNAFTFDDVPCASMEGFLQSLKHEEEVSQREICGMRGKKAKKMATTNWRATQTLYWKGRAFGRETDEFRQLVRSAYQALFNQNRQFRSALLATKNKRLFHSHGLTDPKKTILTEQEFCAFLTELRASNANDVSTKI